VSSCASIMTGPFWGIGWDGVLSSER